MSTQTSRADGDGVQHVLTLSSAWNHPQDPPTDEELIAAAKNIIQGCAVVVYPGDVAKVEVRRRRHWWSLRKSWQIVGTFDPSSLPPITPSP